jgi:histone H3/H4
MSQPLAATPSITSKTAKKRASPVPVRTVTFREDGRSYSPVSGVEGEEQPDILAVKPTTAFKRKHKRQFEIPRVTFRRLVNEIASEYKSDLRIQQEAIDTLQEFSENLVTEGFQRCSKLADLCKLDTVRDEHWRFVHGQSGETLA